MLPTDKRENLIQRIRFLALIIVRFLLAKLGFKDFGDQFWR